MTSDHRRKHDEVRHHFDEDLDEIRRETIHIGALVLENARRAGEAMQGNSLDQVAAVVDADKEIDQRYGILERRVFETIARQQPVAGDLRFLVSTTRMLYELERTGNLVVNCVEAMRRNEGFDLDPRLKALLGRLTRESTAIFARALDALSGMDPEIGAALEVEDDVVDDLVGEFYRGLGRAAEDHGVETAIQLSRVGRYLERIADHGVNIGQHVTYIVTASFPGNRKAAD